MQQLRQYAETLSASFVESAVLQENIKIKYMEKLNEITEKLKNQIKYSIYFCYCNEEILFLHRKKIIIMNQQMKGHGQ